MAKKTKAPDKKEKQSPAEGVELLHCTYAGQDYSPGSNVEMPAGAGGKVTKTCNGQTGSWEPLE